MGAFQSAGKELPTNNESKKIALPDEGSKTDDNKLQELFKHVLAKILIMLPRN